MAKPKVTIQKRAIITFVAVFIVATIVFTLTRSAANKFKDSQVFHGGTSGQSGETQVSLLKEMNPIAVDEGSTFYEVFQSKERVNILALGVNDGMTDTIMVISYDMQNQHIDLISLPRDTYYYRGKGFSNFASHKINAIYSSQGVVKLAEVVSEILYGMPIHYYAVVEYEDVKAVMEVIGGVTMDVPFHMKYDDTTKGYELHIDIPAGEQVIDSSNVMEFLRFRKTNPWYAKQGYKSYFDGDTQRQELQQEFVKKVIKECLKAGNITDVAKVALENVESDMTYAMAAKIAMKAMNGLSADNINAYMLPGTADMIQELSFWIPYEKGISSMLMEIYSIGDGAEADAATPAAVTQ
ncbi:MAG: LCP family protein [Firmicutes bacterium]|nr:LCP family protein [Bacillota bacterium]